MTWNPLASNLAESLKQSGDLTTGHWARAFEETPRHAFVSDYFQSQGGTPTRWKKVTVDDGEEWLRPIYTNATLVTHLDPAKQEEGGLWTGTPTSSSTQPSLTARMLEALDIDPKDRVLDAGTGTGYQAALICHRLNSSHQLVTADIDPALTTTAKNSLSGLGYEPDIITADITAWRWKGTFDKVIVTCAIPSITPSLRKAVEPGGRLVANLFPPMSSALVVLDAQPNGTLEGRFHPDGGSFMPARPDKANARSTRDAEPQEGGSTEVPLEAFDSYHFNFLLAALMPGVQLQYGYEEEGEGTLRRLVAPDGSWAEGVYQAHKRPRFEECGKRGIWSTVEDMWAWYAENSHPRWERFGLTVSPDGAHRLWFESPDGTSWGLPV
ncbi:MULTISPECIES: methyltransferase domain-containing protein [Streptomyces]|uniref:methyltransferase domain-containing protein n=1 Tax=Streptomyces TaxID=1883 RepID=UPI001E584B02|nr:MULTISPECIES: methyltransferase domain-containing protein [Streptomyces]UFQ16458.1 methyltransferase domain-containing protein [Streptomyces huasconensis]WCL86060.1 methyltransferase domain-containing protein [Streptomyces sp. JCM 35825]